MKLRNPRLIRFAGWFIACLLRAWLCTVRYRLSPETARLHPADPAKSRYIYAFWHESLLAPIAFRHVRVHVLISLHADGELITQACRHLGVGVVRGSTTRGGGQGLLGLVHSTEDSHPVLMPDGPRGPRRKVQPGIIMLASRTGVPIVPLGVGFTWSWRAKSWDRFALPLPFSRVTAVAGAPLHVPPDLDRAGIEQYRQRLETEFLEATGRAEAWAAALALGRKAPDPSSAIPAAHFPSQSLTVKGGE